MTAADPAVVWTLPVDWRERCLDSNGTLRLNQWLDKGYARIVKQAPHRTIFRVTVPGCDFFIKEYRAVGLRGRFRELVRPIKAQSEYSKSTQLHERGIIVPRAIGWGVLGPTWSPKASFLLSETVPNAIPLTEYLAKPLTSNERQEIAESLGGYVARLHAAGAIHRDFHPANLLFRKDVRGLPEFVLIDLHEVRENNSCSWHRRRENLITLNRWFILRSTRADRLRFWRSYERGTSLPERADSRPESLETATWQSNAVFWSARAKRYQASSRHIKSVESGHYRGLVMAEWHDRLADTLVNQPDKLFNHQAATMLKDGRASTVVRIVHYERPLILKRFNTRSWLDPFKNVIRQSAAYRSWLLGHALLDAGLPTARPLAVIHRYRFGMPATGYLVTEELKNVVELRAFADATLNSSSRRDVIRKRIYSVARILREFHERFFGHRDLKAANLLTPIDADDHRVWFVDLVGVQRRQLVKDKSRIRDLGRLLASFLNHPVLTRTDRLRFLGCYLNWNLHGKTGWKRWWRELGDVAQRKIERNKRLGRPLA